MDESKRSSNTKKNLGGKSVCYPTTGIGMKESGVDVSSDSQQQCLLVVLLIPPTFLILPILSITSKSVFVFLQFANVDFGWQHAHGHVLRVLPSLRKDLGIMGDELAALGFMRDNLIGVKRRECRACPDARDLGGR